MVELEGVGLLSFLVVVVVGLRLELLVLKRRGFLGLGGAEEGEACLSGIGCLLFVLASRLRLVREVEEGEGEGEA